MNKAQASRVWETTEEKVQKICDKMKIDPENIPDDTIPVYVPDRFYESHPHRYYVYLLEAIANTHMEIQGIDRDVLETCVAQLKEKKLIVLRKSADPDSLDYHDYLISAERAVYDEWYASFMKESTSLIDKIISFFIANISVL